MRPAGAGRGRVVSMRPPVGVRKWTPGLGAGRDGVRCGGWRGILPGRSGGGPGTGRLEAPQGFYLFLLPCIKRHVSNRGRTLRKKKNLVQPHWIQLSRGSEVTLDDTSVVSGSLWRRPRHGTDLSVPPGRRQ